MAMDLFLVLTALPSAPISADPTTDQYYKTTFANQPAVEIRSFSLGVENPTTIGSATGGAGTGKIKLKELYIEKSVDTLSASLYSRCARGGHLAKMQLFLRKTGGATTVPKPYLTYGFATVFVTNIDWGAGEGDDVPVERVTFAYGSLALGYYAQKPDGTLGAKKMATWNQVTNAEPPETDVLTNF